jgi:hypothetical protein
VRVAGHPYNGGSPIRSLIPSDGLGAVNVLLHVAVPSEPPLYRLIDMSRPTLSEALIVKFFAAHGVGCEPVPTRPNERTPDFIIQLASPVVCEVKQIDPNDEDREDIAELCKRHDREPDKVPAIGRWVPDRIRPIFKNISGQLRRASESGTPTLLVIYDATPFRMYSSDVDVMQAMFGRLSVTVWIDENGAPQHSETFFGGDRGLTQTTNRSVSAVGILRGGPEASALSLTVFHNPFARVSLNPSLFDGLPVKHRK